MDNFLNPFKVLGIIGFKSDTIAADFGCSSGGFTIPLAKKLKHGFVYALDIQKEPLSFLKGVANHENINNILTMQCNLEEPKGSKLKDSSLDFVVLANVLFQVKKRSAIISEAARVLKNNRRLLVIDWHRFGPKNKVSPEKITEMANRKGLFLERKVEVGPYHFGLIFNNEKTL